MPAPQLPFEVLALIFVLAQQPSLAFVSREFYEVSRSLGVQARYSLVEFGRARVLDGAVGMPARRPRMANRPEVVLLLLKLGADPRADNQWVFRHACACPWPSIVSVLLRPITLLGGGISETTATTTNTAHWRGGGGGGESGESLPKTNVHDAKGPAVDVHDDYEAGLRIAARLGNVSVIKLFLEAGDIYVDAVGGEPLVLAAGHCHPSAVQLLLEAGANPRAEHSRALRNAILPGDANLPCIIALLDAGADPRAMEDSCLLSACHKSNLAASVGRLRYQIYGKTPSSSHSGVVQLLLSRGADPNARDGLPLVFAAQRGSVNIVQALLDHGATFYNNHPLCEAAERGHVAIVELLVHRAGSDPEAALESAARGGSHPTLCKLLELGASASGHSGRLALRAAARGGWVEIVQELINAGADASDQEFKDNAMRSREIRRMLGLDEPVASHFFLK